jgi:hypothetical protein
MIAPLWRAAKRSMAALSGLRNPAPVRPIVVFESDDWGRVGLPSLQSLKQLQDCGVPIGKSPWDFYGLESDEDILRLGDVLSKFRDVDGKQACFTANFVMANADLERMRREEFHTFRWIAINDGFPSPWNETLLSAYLCNIDRGTFYPGLHGFTHFNVPAMMKLLAETTTRGDRMRQLAALGVPYLASLTPECNFALVERDGMDERFLSEKDQEAWIETGVRLFGVAFGRKPATTCAPGYRANDTTLQIWRRHGLVTAQMIGRRGISASSQLTVLERNVAFEPALAPDGLLVKAMEQARRAVASGFPVVVCSHSINYMSRFLGSAEEGRRHLGELLHHLLIAFPDLRFATDADITSAWQRNDRGWFRSPTMGELTARGRYRQAVA